MDDNFHLRGMRKQIHRLLLKYRPIKFGLVWMEASLDVCLERNRDRERQIPEHVILKMESTFEPPRAAWENYWMTATSKTSTETVVDFIEQCSEIVDLPEVTDPEQQEADRAKTLQNQQHCWDKMLRSWVGQVAKHDKQLARGANMARKVLLQRMKAPNPDITDATFLLDSFLDLVLSSSQKAGDDPTNASSEIPLRSTLKKLLTESS
jgi:tRNA uridine 5-carbamoylmethylation protein Kti12